MPLSGACLVITGAKTATNKNSAKMQSPVNAFRLPVSNLIKVFILNDSHYEDEDQERQSTSRP